MPPFPEKESSLLAKLKKKKPNMEEIDAEQPKTPKHMPQAIMNISGGGGKFNNDSFGGTGTADLLGLGGNEIYANDSNGLNHVGGPSPETIQNGGYVTNESDLKK